MSDNIPALKVTRYRPYYFDETKVRGFEATMRENSGGDWVRYEDYEKQLSAALQYKHELEQCQLDLQQHQGNASEVIRLQAEVTRLRETLAVRDRENGALAEGYLAKMGIKPVATETSAAPVAWRRLIDSPYETHPRYGYTEEPFAGATPLYERPPTPDTSSDGLRAAEHENKRLREQMGEVAILLLQNDRTKVLKWARGVKLHFPDGAPELVAESPAETQADLLAEVTALRCLLADEGYEVGAYTGHGKPLFRRPAPETNGDDTESRNG